jgi:hypothetical protein
MIGLTKRAMMLLAAKLAPVCLLVGCGTTNAVAVDGPSAAATACPPAATAPVAKPTAIATKPTPKPSKKPSTPTGKPTGKPTAKPSSKPAAGDSDPATPTATATDAKAMAAKVIGQMADAPGYDAIVVKEERPKAGGNYIYNNKLRIIGQKDGRVKLDVTQHYKPSNVGVKLGWQLNSGTVTVRPAGALSFLTKDFPATDKQIISPNGYRPDAAELYAIAKRMGDPSYSFELVGKSTVNGTEVRILKVTTTSTNPVDPDIQFEYLGFDPTTNEVKLWEFYGGPDLTTPIHRVTLESFRIRADITAAELKV